MPKILCRPLRLNPSAGASERPRCCPRKSAGARLPRVSWAGTERLSDEESYLLMWSIKVTAVCHKRSTHVRPCVPHTWNCAFHIRGIVRSTYVELCVSHTRNCVFNLRGTMCPTYVELYVPPTWNCMFHLRGTMFHIRGAERSTYWNCEFHILELCVPCTGTVCSKAWNSVGTLRVLQTKSASGAFRCAWCLVCERRLKAERRSYKRVMHVSNPYAEAHGGRGPCACREPT